jgi:hypothetical protein
LELAKTRRSLKNVDLNTLVDLKKERHSLFFVKMLGDAYSVHTSSRRLGHLSTFKIQQHKIRNEILTNVCCFWQGPAASTKSYLNMDAIIAACKSTGAEAVSLCDAYLFLLLALA